MNHKPLIAGAAALLLLSLPLSACTGSPSGATDLNGGAERSFTDEELANHAGSGYFPTTFTFEELLEDHRCESGHAVDGGFTAGGYIVGAEGAPAAGTYWLAGQNDETGDLATYRPAEEKGRYQPSIGVGYLGFTLFQLHEGDAVFFSPASDQDLMRPLDPAPLDVSAPYESGLYRVGVDIPAGTYTITQSSLSEKAIADLGNAQPQAIVYSSLDFTIDNMVSEENLPRLEEGPANVTVTVEDGQFLELFGTVADPGEA